MCVVIHAVGFGSFGTIHIVLIRNILKIIVYNVRLECFGGPGGRPARGCVEVLGSMCMLAWDSVRIFVHKELF